MMENDTHDAREVLYFVLSIWFTLDVCGQEAVGGRFDVVHGRGRGGCTVGGDDDGSLNAH